MAVWGVAAGTFGVVMALAALTQRVRRWPVTLAAALGYSLVSVGLATLVTSFWVQLFVPGALLLAGYWLSGLLFHSPQPWLEAWLLKIDRALLADRWLHRMPRAVTELLEGSYAAVHLVVGGGAIFVATSGVDAVAHYWSLVVTAALASYAPLPWLRSRPPRVLEVGARHGAPTQRLQRQNGPAVAGPYLRRFNEVILDRASVQANTLPSGHVSGAVAAALGVMTTNVHVGWALMLVAGLIAIAAVAGRYHYVVDCVAGAAVALAVFAIL